MKNQTIAETYEVLHERIIATQTLMRETRDRGPYVAACIELGEFLASLPPNMNQYGETGPPGTVWCNEMATTDYGIREGWYTPEEKIDYLKHFWESMTSGEGGAIVY